MLVAVCVGNGRGAYSHPCNQGGVPLRSVPLLSRYQGGGVVAGWSMPALWAWLVGVAWLGGRVFGVVVGVAWLGGL